MKSPEIVHRHPALRWLVPFGIACLAGGITAVTVGSDGSSHGLPHTVPASLVAAVKHSRQTPFTGTVVSRLSAGLPSFPAISGMSEPRAGASFDSLLTGSHTMQIWYGGSRRQRLALLDAGQETDLFRNGDDLWQWSSATGVALHTELRGRAGSALATVPPEALTPAELASRAFAALTDRTDVRVDQDVDVADRRAYELVLTPDDNATKIGSVHVAVDGVTKVPLGVQIYPKGSSSAAVDVAFTSIRFGTPAERNFDFVPPPNAAVTQLGARLAPRQSTTGVVADVVGSGWTAVYRLEIETRPTGHGSRLVAFRDVPTVSGRWGKGRLLVTGLMSVLVTTNGRMYAGAVPPSRLYAVAAQTVRGAQTARN